MEENDLRKEASLEAWKDLYELTKELETLEPWNYLRDTDLISITLKDANEPVFCSIMGNGTGFRGIAVYEGFAGYGDYDMVATVDNSDLPVDYVMYEQSCLMVYWGSMEEVSPEQKKIIDALNLRFHDIESWIYFLSYKTRYQPYLPDEREVLLLIETYKNLIMAVRAVMEQKIKVDFDQGECIYRKYNKNGDVWNMFAGPLPNITKEFPAVELDDDALRSKLKKQPILDLEVSLDFCYTNTVVNDEAFDRPVHPLLFLAVDDKKHEIIAAEILSPNESEIDMALGFFVGFTEQYGRIRKIKARNPWVFGAISELCEDCGVELEQNALEEIDQIEKELLESL